MAHQLIRNWKVSADTFRDELLAEKPGTSKNRLRGFDSFSRTFNAVQTVIESGVPLKDISIDLYGKAGSRNVWNTVLVYRGHTRNTAPDESMTGLVKLRRITFMGKTMQIFLGGAAQNNDWRDALKAMKFKHLRFFDPYKKDWDAKVDIYRELKEMLQSDYVVFYRGGIGTDNERQILNIVNKPKYRDFSDLEALKRFLLKLDEGLGG